MSMSGVFFYNKKGPCRSGIDDQVLIDPHEVNGVKTDLCLSIGAQNDKIFTIRQAAGETIISGIVFMFWGPDGGREGQG